MTEPKAADLGVSQLDRAHGLRLAGDREGALRLAAATLEASPDDTGAACLIARSLWELGRPGLVQRTCLRALARSLRRADLGTACVCALLLQEAGGDRQKALDTIARAFGSDSARLSDTAPASPPPLPARSVNVASWAARSGDALLTAAEQLLTRFCDAEDTLPDNTPLPRLPLFGALESKVLSKLLALFVLREHAAGQTVMRQGEDGREVYLLVRGVLNVLREDAQKPGQGVLLAVLGPAALFGEMALVSQAPRAASVISVEPAQVLAVGRGPLEVLAQQDAAIARELGAFCQRRMLTNLLRHSRILSAVAPQQRQALIQRFTSRSFAPAELLVHKGEEGGSLFLVASGLVEVRSPDASGDDVVLAQLGPGEVVGEISLVLRRPATADVAAVHRTVALELTWTDFHDAIKEHPGLLAQLYEIATQREAELRSVVAQEARDISDTVLL
jgi:cAMP-dependent protein kinase regulator